MLLKHVGLECGAKDELREMGRETVRDNSALGADERANGGDGFYERSSAVCTWGGEFCE
jgi:hypothetical protein